ncbi:MAG: succinate dehydrogenase assembly factor 2 [Geminicoccus sp.]|nr:succinate dehydrogenase assembly factor 2 [Geminicoccus sp.]HCI00132.1 succinate dehydrogenase assembly factor 2 [Alphaproteobacteria bacterium]|tara:strand:+ start:504 stop:782 length:279 start_codon:yes stop_codon:yes gene_type:complete
MDYEQRRKRALWRAGHRGTRELDLLMSQFVRDFLPSDAAAGDADALERMSQIEQLQAVNDPDVQEWLQRPDSIPAELPEPLLSALRSFEYRL